MATRDERREGRQTQLHQLQCAKCGCASGLYARGWRGYRTDNPDQGDAPALGFFCPTCSQSELGTPRRSSRG